jgi:hypothetical protein
VKLSLLHNYLRARRLRGRAEPEGAVPFVVGVGRSGTTLLRLMLDAHPALAVPPETHFINNVLEASGRLRFNPERLVDAIVEDSHRRWNDFGLEREELLARVSSIPDFNVSDGLRAFYELYAERQSKRRWGDKTPDYLKRMRRIKRTLPEARFIHVIRDGRDVMLSTNRRIAQRGHREELTAERGAERWRRQIERAREDAPHLGGEAYIEIRYEDLVTDTESTLRRVCTRIDLDYDPVMLRYHETAAERLREMAGAMPARDGRPERKAGERLRAHKLATKPPTRERIEVWREEMDPAEVAEFEAGAGSLLAELGYGLSGERLAP